MKYILLPAFLVITLSALAQNASIKNDTAQERMDLTPPTVYTYVEQMPEPGYDMAKYLSEHLKYPDIAYKANIQGRVIVKFIVNEDGSTSDFKVEKGIGGGCDEEAIKALRTMPKWKAGVHNGLPVRVWTMLPVSFTMTKPGIIYNTLFDHIDQPPKADYDIDKYIAEHIRYPMAAWTSKKEGNVLVQFLVEKDGTISECFVKERLFFGCDDEAIDIVKSMPKWAPGIHKGMPVKVWTTLKVPFHLSDSVKLLPDSLNIKGERMPGPDFDLPKYLSDNLQYPDLARNNNISGRVIVKFVVNEDGSLTDFHVLRGIGGGCDEEAVRVLKKMPRWKPGIQNGKPVKVYFTQPISFNLVNSRY